MTGIGGDCFCLVAQAGRAGVGLQRLGPRRRRRSPTEKLIAQGLPRKIPATSPHAVTVPGAIDAWDAILKAHGRFGLDRVLQPAIRHAENGFPVAPRVALRLGRRGRQAQAAMRARRSIIWSTARAPAIGERHAASGARRDLKAIAARRREGVLRRRDRRRHRRDRRRPRAACSRAEDLARHTGEVVDADLDELSRPRRGGDAAERAGAHRAGAAQYPRAVRLSQSSIRSGRSGCISRSRPRGSPSACATRISPIRRYMREPVAGLLDKGFAKKLAALHRSEHSACRCRRRRRPAATRSI